jgi:hypothetical protein
VRFVEWLATGDHWQVAFVCGVVVLFVIALVLDLYLE